MVRCTTFRSTRSSTARSTCWQRFELELTSHSPASCAIARDPSTSASGLAALGYTMDGRLPFAADEADAIAKLFAGESFVEKDRATRYLAPDRCERTHSLTWPRTRNFFAPTTRSSPESGTGRRPIDDPGHLQLRLGASLATLSACQTGRNVVGGGDELLGLMRAFLYAGASSLVLTFWSVEDASTATLMRKFYTNPRRAAFHTAHSIFFRFFDLF